MQLVRNYRKSIAITFISILILNVLPVTSVLASGGPEQPEYKTFTQLSTSDMVNNFTGNFNYNIPLLDVGGYPVNISYTSNPSMEQDASWVGLGWNINAGAINRAVRGLPDDFSGDSVVTTTKRKINRTLAITPGVSFQLFGLDFLSAGVSLGVTQNSYTGSGSVMGLDLNLAILGGDKSSYTAGLGLSAVSSTEDGVTVTPRASFELRNERENGAVHERSLSFGFPYSTVEGFKALTVKLETGTKFKWEDNLYQMDRPQNGGSVFSFAHEAYPPPISTPTFSTGMSFHATIGAEFWGVHPNFDIRASYSQQSFRNDASPSLLKPFDINTESPDLAVSSLFYADPLSRTGINVFENAFRDWVKVRVPAYGYLYAQNASTDKSLMDFNREKEGGFSSNKPNLAVPVFTHDIYNVNGQGISGMYRPFRNDVGTLFDPLAVSGSANLDLPGVEIGAGNAVHIGTDFAMTNTESRSGIWKGKSNECSSILTFKNYYSDPVKKPYFFKQAGEKAADFSDEFFSRIGEFDPVRIKLDAPNASAGDVFHRPSTKATNIFERQHYKEAVEEIEFTDNTREYRQPINQSIDFLNAAEARELALEKSLYVYPLNAYTMNSKGGFNPSDSLSRMDTYAGRQSHHISEVTATKPDGTRYIYGFPLYNLEQKDVTFSLECNGEGINYLHNQCESGLVSYNHGTDNSLDNEKGIDHGFDSRFTPPYATTYLLTSIVSDDYTDLRGDGPTDDDLGSYTLFNYSKPQAYKWRAPFEEQLANYFPGFNSNFNDGKGSYVYGTREEAYLHSIVTKTHVAEFYLEDREDAIGVKGEIGGYDGTSTKLKKLTRIDLYTKADKLKEVNTNGRYVAIPIKSVHFEYDYSLCKGIPNNTHQNDNGISNQGGKLTLKRIYFSYRYSNKGRLSPYEFEYGYGDELYNPAYQAKAQDRWGVYKPHEGTGNDCRGVRNNIDLPYTPQDKSLVDQYAAAWNLTKIILPSGAIMNIQYESDDYAYVQDKSAMHMFTILGTGNNSDASVSSDGAMRSLGDYLIFRLQEPIPGNLSQAEANEIIRQRYLKNMASGEEKLYYKVSAGMPNGVDDYVTGYADIDFDSDDAYGAKKKGLTNYTYGYVKLKQVKSGNNFYLNPIQKSGIELVKLSMPFHLKDRDIDNVKCGDDFGDDIMKVLLGLTEIWNSVQITTLTYKELSGHDIAKEIRLNKSLIRLYNPYQKKLGGGSRVKAITINDNWQQMIGNNNYQNAVYGQEYTYTKIDDATGDEISSGVASYEPMIGGEENPFRQPIFYSRDTGIKTCCPIMDRDHMMETPMGEDYFPGPNVGYSEVSVRSIAVLPNSDTIYTKTGKTVYEYYTSKDFPTKVDHTTMKTDRYGPTIIGKILMKNVEDYLTVSQGYVVELNDMHGKEKAVHIYPEAGSTGQSAPLSSIFYNYQVDENGDLDNQVDVINRSPLANRNDAIESRMVGVDYDMVADMNDYTTENIVVATQGNLETFFAGIFPILVPIVLPDLMREIVQFRSAVTAKVIHRYGLLKEIVTQDIGKQNKMTNLLYDAETGEVVLSSSLNEFDDPVYSFSYPAYFAYDGMGPAYKNAGVTINTTNIDTIANASTLLVPGDELSVFNVDSTLLKQVPDSVERNFFFKRGWVESVEGDVVKIIDINGYAIRDIMGDGRYLLKVIRSGRRNLQSLSIGSVVTLENPMKDEDGDGQYDRLEFSEVLETNAVEYDDQWKTFCECVEPEQEDIIK